MPHPIAKPNSSNNYARCTHRYHNGRRCRISAAESDTQFCPIHAKLPENQIEAPDVTATLTANLSEFRSAIPINDFLARLLLLLAQNRIGPRKAAVLTYITSQLLRTLPAIDRELNPPVDPNQRVQIIYDIQRPQRPGPIEAPHLVPASASQPASPEPPKSEPNKREPTYFDVCT